MKDYYQILGVPPGAAADDIKRVFRKLAFRYHPDKNPGNPHAEAHFKEILEAYAILSDERSRAAYDVERWLSGTGKRTNYRETITPQWLLKVCRELNTSLQQMDTHRMSQTALRAYILLILSDSHLGILETEGDKAINEQIVRELLKATRLLHIDYTADIATRLELLARGNQPLLDDMSTRFREHSKSARFDRALPWIVILVTMALCAFMYLFSAL